MNNLPSISVATALGTAVGKAVPSRQSACTETSIKLSIKPVVKNRLIIFLFQPTYAAKASAQLAQA
jgi:hypothetical protein